MVQSSITKETFAFLDNLKENNNRDWFQENKETFLDRQEEMKQFLDAVLSEMTMHDHIERLKLYRIYRDVRFSKNKTPYKINFSGSMERAGLERRGGYFIQIASKGSFIAAGFWNPEKEDLLRIRKEIALDAQSFKAVIEEPEFKKTWGTLSGDAVKTAPRGFDKEDPSIALIRHKQFLFVKHFTDKQVLQANFPKRVSDSFKVIRPFFDLMSAILTTNLDGESLID